MGRLSGIVVAALALAANAAAQGNEQFQTAMRSYSDLRRDAAAGVPSSAARTEAPELRQQAPAQQIQSKRPDARQGDMLGAVTPEIRDLLRRELAGPQGAAMLSAIEQTNVYGARPRVNHRYPP